MSHDRHGYPERDPGSSCQGKRRYASWKAAERVARSLRRRHEERHTEPYPCRWCGGFHVGEAMPRKAIAKAINGDYGSTHDDNVSLFDGSSDDVASSAKPETDPDPDPEPAMQRPRANPANEINGLQILGV